MIKTVKQACRFNAIIQDYRMSQGIENLADWISDEGDGREFYTRNYVTHGMEQLFREGMLRLSSKSDQAVFELTQAMGRGKTHMMVALGLLARLCTEVLPPELAERIDFDVSRVAAFNGRNDQTLLTSGPKAVDQKAWAIDHRSATATRRYRTTSDYSPTPDRLS